MCSDDEPDDGPQHYILIVGFYQPHLISALDSLGIHMSNIIKLDVEREGQSEAPEETVAEENHRSTEDQGNLLRIWFRLYLIIILQSACRICLLAHFWRLVLNLYAYKIIKRFKITRFLLVLCSEVDTLKQTRQGELDVFWKQLGQVLNSGNMGSRLCDVARLNYSMKIHLLPQDKSSTEAMVMENKKYTFFYQIRLVI